MRGRLDSNDDRRGALRAVRASRAFMVRRPARSRHSHPARFWQAAYRDFPGKSRPTSRHNDNFHRYLRRKMATGHARNGPRFRSTDDSGTAWDDDEAKRTQMAARPSEKEFKANDRTQPGPENSNPIASRRPAQYPPRLDPEPCRPPSAPPARPTDGRPGAQPEEMRTQSRGPAGLPMARDAGTPSANPNPTPRSSEPKSRPLPRQFEPNTSTPLVRQSEPNACPIRTQHPVSLASTGHRKSTWHPPESPKPAEILS